MTSTQLESILAEMRALPRWCFFKIEPSKKEGKQADKVPYQRNRQYAKSNDPTTWVHFAEVTTVPAGFDGINFAFVADDGLICVDLDHRRNAATGDVEPWATEIIERINSYTEVSYSGTGFHIIFRGKALPKGYKHENIEVYFNKKVISVTGDVHEMHFGIADHDISWLIDQITVQRAETNPPSSGDASKDDFALACRLARQTDCDQEKTLGLFLLQSKQDPKKLQRADYAPRTVRAAIARVMTSQPLVQKSATETIAAEEHQESERS